VSRNALQIELRSASFFFWLSLASICESVAGPASSVQLQPLAAPSRVVLVQDREAVDAFRARPAPIHNMVEKGILTLTGSNTIAQAWRAVVSTQDVVGIKVVSGPGPNSGTRPAVVAAVIEGLLAAGVPPRHIVIWDRRLTDLRLAGFDDLMKQYGVRLAGSMQAGYDEKTFYDVALLGTLVWGDLEFGKKGERVGRRSFVSKLLTHDITKVISITPLLNDNAAGVSGHLSGLALDSVDNVGRFESDPGRLAMAVPELYALRALGDKVVLNITDALICQYEGGERGLLHFSATLNQLWFSKDPVALDVLSLKVLDEQRKKADAPPVKPNTELYDNAALLQLGTNDAKGIKADLIKIGE